MIELNKKTQQDFLNREWVQKLLDAGVNMSDAKYWIVYDPGNGYDEVRYEPHADYSLVPEMRALHTYTVSELLYKLHEYVYPTIDGIQYSGGLKFCKDAPSYMWYYDLTDEDFKENQEYLYAEAEYPIESLAMLLIQCHKKDIGIKRKDTGDISDK